MVEIIDGVEHLGDIGLVGPVYGVIKWIGTIPDHDLDVSFIFFFESNFCQLSQICAGIFFCSLLKIRSLFANL